MKKEDMLIGTCSGIMDYDPEFPDWNNWMLAVIEGMKKEAQELRDQGYSFALIDPEPMHISSFDLSNFMEPETPCRRRWRLDLIGGGQLRAIETYEAWDIGIGRTILRGVQLGVVAHLDDRLVKASARIHTYISEATMMGVVLKGPQEIADRAAATLRAINNTPENFFALLSQRQRCAVCNRPLADEISKLVAVGPECARRHGIPHSLDAASRRLELRRQLGLYPFDYAEDRIKG